MSIDILKKLLIRVYKIFRNILFDLRYGTFLGGSIKTKHANLGAYDVVNTDYSALPYLFKDLITDSDVLVDVGCGRGRVINWLLANKVRNNIIGIEIDNEIADSTRRRLRKYKNVKIVCGNVLDNIPENGTIFYLYNPFEGSVMEKFKDRLLDTIGPQRRICLIYHNCEHIELFRCDPRWVVEEVRIPFDEHMSAHIRFVPERARELGQSNREDV